MLLMLLHASHAMPCRAVPCRAVPRQALVGDRTAPVRSTVGDRTLGGSEVLRHVDRTAPVRSTVVGFTVVRTVGGAAECTNTVALI